MACIICDKNIYGEIHYESMIKQTQQIHGHSFMGGWVCFECSIQIINDLREKRRLRNQKYKCVNCLKVFNYDKIINLPHTPRYIDDSNLSVCHQCLVDTVLESMVSVDIISDHSKYIETIEDRLKKIEDKI